MESSCKPPGNSLAWQARMPSRARVFVKERRHILSKYDRAAARQKERASAYIDDVFLAAISLTLSGMGDGARSSNVAGLVSERSYDIALPVTGQRPAMRIEPCAPSVQQTGGGKS
jgi:hypothetical protein